MIYYYIIYDIVAKNGNKRTYRRRFDDIDKAFEYARKKDSEPQVRNVRGFEHEEMGNVVYVFKMAL